MKYLPVLFLSALCAGCAAGLLETKQPVQQTYVISPTPARQAGGDVLPVDLVVARPIVRPGLYTERIAVRHADRRIDYFSASRWSATTDVVVQSLLVESLRNSGRVRSVQNDLSAFTAKYMLQTELRDFQAEYAAEGQAPTVRVSLVCTLGRIRARQPLAEYTASASVVASGNNMREVIAAFEQAYREAARSLVEHTASALAGAAQAEADS